jgi:subtilisin-like proprotein convertase family protein
MFKSYSQCNTISNNTPTTVTSTTPGIMIVTVTDNVAISDLNVNLNLTHEYISDLNITLTSPAATTITIILTNFCGGANINATFDDAGTALNCGAGITGVTQAFDALSAFNGEMSAGDWTLTVADALPLDDGVINSFGVEYCSPTLEVNDFNNVLDITMHPNPSNGKVGFTLNDNQKVQVVLFDMSGRKVLTQNLTINKNAMDVSALKTGTYIAQVTTDNKKTVTKKLIIN